MYVFHDMYLSDMSGFRRLVAADWDVGHFLSLRREIIIPWLGSHGVTRLLRECMCGATPIHKLLAKRSHVRVYVGQRCTCPVGLPHVHTCAYTPSPDVRQPLL